MQEEYLHLVWRLKRLPMHQLYLTNGQQLRVLECGQHNLDSGPDFFNGKIEIEGIIWVGNIEFHVKASDWFRHQHHHDPAYSNTILHVVLDYDTDILINEKPLPTLELKPYLDFNHWKKYASLLLHQQWIPCENQLKYVSQRSRSQQLETALLQRLSRKAKEIEKQFYFFGGDLLAVYYSTYAKAFGLKVNELPFLELASKIPLSLLWRRSAEEVRIMMLGCAGFFQNAAQFALEEDSSQWELLKLNHKLNEMVFHSWKFKGLRPASFPNHRIPEFGEFCRNQDFFRLHELEVNEILQILSAHFKHSGMMKNLLVINVLVPVFWWYGTFNNQERLKEKALVLLKSQGAETNSVINRWKKLGFAVKSSSDSQGLLELKNEFCNDKKCLSCKIGNEIVTA